MAFVTFVLVSGAVLGIQGRFSPEQLGIVSSEALGWLSLEVLIFLLFMYVLNVQSNISYLDAIAFSGYKFVSMIVTLLSYLLLDLPGYYFSLVYLSFAIAFLLIRTLKLKVLPYAEAYSSEGNKLRVYLLLMTALVQPFLIWWMSRRMLLTPTTKPIL
ncbi:Protein YIF1B [Fasciola gigantica]|uniref:Protein YIF1 n=1 Tax=Fasciola gigantica TaxID=46835 RepID=A0A504Z7E5_FASGI|nr:Protein YIF1B [Fasciola gigantica]